MEEIGTAFGMLSFLAVAGFIVYIVVKKAGEDKVEHRPVENKQDSVIMNTLKNITEHIPGMSESDKELAQQKGSWYTTADFPQTWEYITNSFKNDRSIFPNDLQHQWQEFRPDPNYRTMLLQINWKDIGKHEPGINLGGVYGSTPGYQNPTFHHQVKLILTLKPLEPAGTEVQFQFTVVQEPVSLMPNPLSLQVVRHTNHRLKSLCLQLSQDPNRGSIF